MAQLLDGKKVRDELVETLRSAVKKCRRAPTLTIIQVGDRADSNSYISQKKNLAEKIGAKIIHIRYEESAAEEEILKQIAAQNADDSVHGIIIQIPLPAHLDKTRLIEAIHPKKDVDGLTAFNTKLLWEGSSAGLVPATARGILTLLDYYKIPVAGKKVVVVGRSSLVGKPTALALMNRNATVTVCHRHTDHLAEETKAADILVVAIGRPRFITAEHVRAGQTVIDVGIGQIEEGGTTRFSGDVDFKSVEPVVAAITPVPGGTGPMTVVSLFANLAEACRNLG